MVAPFFYAYVEVITNITIIHLYLVITDQDELLGDDEFGSRRKVGG